MEKNKIARKKEWCYENVLLHVPHSSMNFPEGTPHHFNDLDEDERLLIDYYTDELFVPDVPVKHIEHAVFPYCRLYCDVERLINDPLEKEGLGISYNRRVGDDSCAYRSFSKMEDAFSMYVDFHSMVAKRMVMCGDNLLLIDCHSFSNLPNLLNSAPPDIDICIGYNDDDTFPGNVVVDCITRHFESRGYKVGINTPFSNSKTFAVPMEYHSVMIEVNKRMYMDEATLEKSGGFGKLRDDILSLYDVLLNGD